MLLLRFTADDLPLVEPWFDDDQTRRWLGDAEWAQLGLRLAGPDRFSRLVVVDGRAVGLIDCETYSDHRASFAIVTAPAMRGRGLGRAAIRHLLACDELADVVEVFVGIERGNAASERLTLACGFRQVSEEDEDGFRYFAWRRDGRYQQPWVRP